MRTPTPYFEHQCPICKEDFNSKIKPFVIKTCQHVCCRECLFQILSISAKCPICNQFFYDLNDEKLEEEINSFGIEEEFQG